MALDRLVALRELTDLRLRARQAEMAQLLAQESALRSNLSDLAVARQPRWVAREGTADVAGSAGAEVRWQVWVDQRRAIINAELAQVLSRKADLAAQLRIAFGKDQVVQVLVRRQALAWRKATPRQF